MDNFNALSRQPDTPQVLLQAMDSAITNQKPTVSANVVFTDDWAPIEWITNDMIFDFVISGSTENLQ